MRAGYNYVNLMGEMSFEEGKYIIEVQRDFREQDGTFRADKFEVEVSDVLKNLIDDQLYIRDNCMYVNLKGKLIIRNNKTIVFIERCIFLNNQNE